MWIQKIKYIIVFILLIVLIVFNLSGCDKLKINPIILNVNAEEIENEEEPQITEEQEQEPETNEITNQTTDERLNEIQTILTYICGILLFFVGCFLFKVIYKFFDIFF